MKIARAIGLRILLSSLLMLLSCVGLCPVAVKQVLANEYPGVSEGQSLHYSMDSRIVGGNDTVVMNRTEYHYLLNLTVQSVNSSLIQFVSLWYNESGIVSERNRFEDVGTGLWLYDLLTGFEPFFVAANLTAGDLLVNLTVPYAGFPVTINETILTDYLGFPRETNHVMLENTNWQENVSNVEVSCNATYEYFFDKLTGASVRSIYDFQYYRGNESDLLVTNERWEYVVLSSDLLIPEFAPSVFFIVFCTTSLLLIAVSTMKCRRALVAVLSSRGWERERDASATLMERATLV